LSTAATKRRTQAERREEAESRLIRAAIRLVGEKGYDGFTLAEVGEAAGYSRGLPAHYFERKENLLAVVAEYMTDGYREMIARLPHSEPGLPRIANKIREYTKIEGHVAGRALAILVAESLHRPGLRRTISTVNARGLADLEADMRDGVAAGNIRADADAKLHAAMIYSFLRGQMTFAISGAKFDGQATGETFIAMLESVLRPNP
jgi:AcrR family transcriptional regulator